MHSPQSVRAIVEQVREQVGVEAVFGEPVTAEGRTVIPVARLSFGFGGGFGGPGGPGGPKHGPGHAHPPHEGDPDTNWKRGLKRRLKGGDDHWKTHEHGKKREHKAHKRAKKHDHGRKRAHKHGHEPSPGSGGGMGGKVTVKPVGVVELTSEGTRFVPIVSTRRLLAVVGLGAAIGYALGRRRVA